MKTRLSLSALLLGVLGFFTVSAQDFSNKGKEFWLAYSYHVGMVQSSGGAPTMTLYITSDVTTNYTVEIFGGPVLQNGTITAGQVTQFNIPNTYFINDEGLFSKKAIRVTGEKPIVVYSYITRSAASAATLCLPTNVLGKDYFSANFTQLSNENSSNSYITIVGVEDNTTVEVVPAGNTKNGWVAGNAYSVSLNKGDIYQVLGTVNGLNGADLTGSHIRSVASGSGGCKRIAVFSGSGKIRIPATGCAQNASDNLYQQLYPTGTWGKKYLTVPSFNNPNNYYRVIKSNPGTNVYVNGTLVPPAAFTNNTYYQFFNNRPNLIEADEPISVAQYFTTQGCDGNPANGPYDPDMIMLNPVEQNIDKVTLVSSNIVASGPQHHIHVIMPNTGTGLSSFKIDGSPVAASAWQVHPGNNSFSYAYLSNLAQGYHTLSSDSGFNAIAYGYGQNESYGYSAGANVKDLYQFVSVQNQYATVSFPAACKNSPFFFSMTFPYQPTQIKWQFSGLFPDVTITSPTYDSSWVVNGKQLYRYKLPTPYTITSAGTYPIKVLASNPTTDGCNGEQEINYDLQVFERPVANFSFAATGCSSDKVSFTDNTNTNGRPAIAWSWEFGDGGKADIKDPDHLYSAGGSFNVKYSTITDIGCISDTITKTVVLTEPPMAKFSLSSPNCAGKVINFNDLSTAVSGTITKWTWNFGDATPAVVMTSNAAQSHTYAATGTYNVTLKVETSTGCQSTVFSLPVTVSPNPVPNFTFGNACLPTGNMQFTDASTISNGTQGQFTYQWRFGDGGIAAVKDPSHNYASTGPYNATLIVTSNAGCIDSATKAVNTIYAQPQAAFTAPAEVCFGSAANFTDQTTVPSSTATQWQWDFGDGSSTQQNPSHTYSSPGVYTVKLTATSAIGCVSTVATRTITVNSLPVANFSVSAPNCVTKEISFSDASVANAGNIVKWTWDLGDGATSVNTSGAAFTHSYAATGIYTVSLKVETDKGCISTVFSKPVVVNPLPVPGFAMPDNCLNDPFSQFMDTSSIPDGTQSGFTYSWNFGDGNANAGNPNTSTAKNPQHRYTAVGTYDVALTVTSNAGCSASLTQAFTVNGTVPQSLFTVNDGPQHCSNAAVRITNNSTVDVGKLVKLDIYWDYNNDPTNKQTFSYPAAGTVFDHTYPEFFTPATRDVVIRVIAYSGENCLHSSSQTVTLSATPQIVFGAVGGVCADVAPFALTQATVANGLPGTGSYSGPGISNGTFSPQVAGKGIHTIRYSFTGTNGCTNFKEVTVEVYAVPTVDAGPDRFVLEGGSAVLLGSGTGSNLTYAWTPATNLSNAAIAQPTVKPTDDITYTLKVTSGDGCSATDQVFVKFLKTPTIPNVFTPNGDGINDRWDIKYLESYPGATVEIFNRYGQLVFQSTGYTKPWDGTVKGKALPAGTYYYIINPKNGRQQMSGFVDIVR